MKHELVLLSVGLETSDVVKKRDDYDDDDSGGSNAEEGHGQLTRCQPLHSYGFVLWLQIGLTFDIYGSILIPSCYWSALPWHLPLSLGSASGVDDAYFLQTSRRKSFCRDSSALRWHSW